MLQSLRSALQGQVVSDLHAMLGQTWRCCHPRPPYAEHCRCLSDPSAVSQGKASGTAAVCILLPHCIRHLIKEAWLLS